MTRTTDNPTPPAKKVAKADIPLVKKAVVLYIEREETAGKKATDELWSLLHGPRERHDAGKHAAGPALAAMHGMDPCWRLTDTMMTQWFAKRSPLTLAPATRKKHMSGMRGFLGFCVTQGLCDPTVMNACVTVPDSPPRDEWLQPEQIVALQGLIADQCDDYEIFAIEILLDLGVRVEEACSLTTASLNRRAKTVNVVGKGRGAGKPRSIPVDDDFIARWDAHIKRHGIRAGGWILFKRDYRFIDGSRTNAEWIPDKSRRTTAKALQNLTRRVGDIAERELDPDVAPTFKLTPKVFRRTYACTQVILHALGLGGLDLVSLQAAMGHERLDTTRVYLSNVSSYLNAHLTRVNTGLGAQQIVEKLHALGP